MGRAPATAITEASAKAIGGLPASEVLSNSLNPFEQGVIDVFVRLAEVLGMPKSVGEIYGVLFASAKPMAFQDIVDRLSISKGSTSQGLRLLKGLGAVRSIYVAGDRRDHFVPETELRALLSGFLREKVTPHLESGMARIQALDDLARESGRGWDEGETAVLRKRLEKLRAWHKRGRAVVPIVSKLFG